MTHFNQNNFVRIILALVGALLLVAVPLSADTTTVPFDPRQTYLLTNNDPEALDSIPIDLASLGLSSGMDIELQVTGTVCYYWDGITCHIGFSIPWSVGGVFSSTSQLGPPSIQNRVTGAIASDGPPVFTIPTYYGNIPTDIPQDFSITAIGDSLSGPFTVVTIPTGANFLFFTLNDSFFGDNYSTDLAFHIAPVPEPGTLAMMGAGLLAGIGAIRRKMHLFVLQGQPQRNELNLTGKENPVRSSSALSGFAAVLITLAIPVAMTAQNNSSPGHSGQHEYRLIDMGTLGGPNSYFEFVTGRPLNNHGVATGGADTSVMVSPPYCLIDCYLGHTFRWQNGEVTDLGALPVEFAGSGPNDITESGTITGVSFNGGVDLMFDIPYFDAVIWHGTQLIDLGTFGGPLSYANQSNNRGQTAGFALNTTADSFDLGDFCQNFPMPTQMHAFIWQNGSLQDLGTLGGTDSCALFINERGEAIGNSFTNTVVNPTTGLPTLHPFVWERGAMIDLGTLGGTLALVSAINERGQIVGLSNLAGDSADHPFLWDRGRLRDLGTLGGNNGEANAVNDAGVVVGKADLPGSQTHDAFLWKQGSLTDLGTVGGDPCSNAFAINSQGQVVGTSSDCFTALHAFLWEDGGPMLDLNSLVHAPGGTLVRATYINERGEITAQGNLSNGDTHAFLLIPCNGHSGQCENDLMVEAGATTQQASHAISESRQNNAGMYRVLGKRARERY